MAVNEEYFSAKSVLASFLSSDPREQADILSQMGMQVGIDDKSGQLVVADGDKWKFVNKQGFSLNDAVQFGVEAFYMVPAMRAAGFVRPMARSIAMKLLAGTARAGVAGGVAAGTEALRQGAGDYGLDQQRIGAAAVGGAGGQVAADAIGAALKGLANAKNLQYDLNWQKMVDELPADMSPASYASDFRVKTMKSGKNAGNFQRNVQAMAADLSNRAASVKLDPEEMAGILTDYNKWKAIADKRSIDIVERNLGRLATRNPKTSMKKPTEEVMEKFRQTMADVQEIVPPGFDADPKLLRALNATALAGATGGASTIYSTLMRAAFPKPGARMQAMLQGKDAYAPPGQNLAAGTLAGSAADRHGGASTERIARLQQLLGR